MVGGYRNSPLNSVHGGVAHNIATVDAVRAVIELNLNARLAEMPHIADLVAEGLHSGVLHGMNREHVDGGRWEHTVVGPGFEQWKSGNPDSNKGPEV